MIIILIFFGIYILFFGKKEGIKIYLGFSLIILGFIFLLLSTTDLIPKQTVTTIQKIIPMENDLNSSEKSYFYDDGDTITYYTLEQKEMKFSSNIVKFNIRENSTNLNFVHIISVEFTPIWSFILGYKKSEITEVVININ